MFLADKGLDINVRDQYGRTPVGLAAFYSNHTFINLLLSHGANTAGDSWNSHESPLHYILSNTWDALGDIPELKKHIETAEIPNHLFNNHSVLPFDIYTNKRKAPYNSR